MYAYLTPDFDVTTTSYEFWVDGVPTSVAPNFAVAGESMVRPSPAGGAGVAWFSVGSIDVIEPSWAVAANALLSVKYVSCAVAAVRASDLALESYALPFWLRKAGMAIAARMPMIRITTRSSIRVKPFSS